LGHGNGRGQGLDLGKHPLIILLSLALLSAQAVFEIFVNLSRTK